MALLAHYQAQGTMAPWERYRPARLQTQQAHTQARWTIQMKLRTQVTFALAAWPPLAPLQRQSVEVMKLLARAAIVPATRPLLAALQAQWAYEMMLMAQVTFALAPGLPLAPLQAAALGRL